MSTERTYQVVGLMSGTSMDGLDLVYTQITIGDGAWSYNIAKSISIAYPLTWRTKLQSAIDLPKNELDALDYSYGHWLGLQVKNFIQENGLSVELISSHGHTVFHEPSKGVTRQIGNGQSIAKVTGIRTVCDFRSLDVELGGQGAPLVPIGDKLLFSEYQACLNLGGIANISYQVNGKMKAFDIGMANMPINHLANQLGLEFDKDGTLAKSGVVNEKLLNTLNSLDYFNMTPPKSLGIEWFNNQMLPIINSASISIEDKLATVVEHEAFQIAKVFAEFETAGQGSILITGGGVYNQTLINSIRNQQASEAQIDIPTNEVIEFKEALIFALLGVLKIRGEINCLKDVTGASRDSSSGVIFDPEFT